MVSTDMVETPFILEGDYTPEIGVTYKVIVGADTTFVIVDSIDDVSIFGHHYLLQAGSDCVSRQEFRRDKHWKEERSTATVYLYQQPEFNTVDDALYQRPKYKVHTSRNIEYGQAMGYWCSRVNTENDSYLKIIGNGLKSSIKRTNQSLRMDIYSPMSDDSTRRRPLILLLHGGGFYVGDKSDSLTASLCRHFASMGYVAASANYRMGFLPTRADIERSGYVALQDAHAAMRYLVAHAQKYGIDTALIFAGGSSAGSITAMNLAYMTDKDRPAKLTDKKIKELGKIAASGNSYRTTFNIKALINMWGALTNLNMMKNSRTDIISFHGDADKVVPYNNGYPFSDISSAIGKKVFDQMYGSYLIDRKAREIGLRSELYTFEKEGHSLHHHKDGSWNTDNYNFIRDKSTAFLYRKIAGNKVKIEYDRMDPRHYWVSDTAATNTKWDVEGGFIVRLEGNDIWVVWREDAKTHSLGVSGTNSRGYGFNDRKPINIE